MSDLINEWDRNYDAMVARDEQAKAKGLLIGRYVKKPYADGYAYYEIVKENKNTLNLKVVTNIGDDWVVPHWGTAPKVNKKSTVSRLEVEDKFYEMISKK